MMRVTEDFNMTERKARELLGWCENEDCGEPIYHGDPHVEAVSSGGNRYFYHPQCQLKPITPDVQLEKDEI